MGQASLGDTVRVHYSGRLDSGDEFDSSKGRDPLELTLGQGMVIKGLEAALVGMAPGDQKTITLEIDEAYGPWREDLVHDIPRDRIPEEIPLEVGMELGATTDSGDRLAVTVVSFDDAQVKLDANHPLAGKVLTFELELVEIV